MSYISHFSWCCNKKNSCKKQQRGGRHCGRRRRLVTLHLQPGSRGRCTLLLSFFSLVYAVWEPSSWCYWLRESFSAQINLSGNIHHHTQRCVFMVTLHPFQFTMTLTVTGIVVYLSVQPSEHSLPFENMKSLLGTCPQSMVLCRNKGLSWCEVRDPYTVMEKSILDSHLIP